jgi:hypothetical protein
MNFLVAAGIALIIVIPLALLVLFRRRGKSAPADYRVVPALFSADERELYAVLCQLFGDRYAIFGRVRAGDLIQRRSERDRREWSRDYGDLAGHSFSFVLCSRNELGAFAAVDVTAARRGEAPRDKVNDRRVRDLCTAAGLTLIELTPARLVDREQLRDFLEHALVRPPLPLPTGDGRTEPHISRIDGLELE